MSIASLTGKTFLFFVLCALQTNELSAQREHSVQVELFGAIGGASAVGSDLRGTIQGGGRLALMYGIADGWALGIAGMASANISPADYNCLAVVHLDTGLTDPCPVYYRLSGTSLIVQRRFGGAGGDPRWRIGGGLGAFWVFPENRRDTSRFSETVSALGINFELSKVVYRADRMQFLVGVQEYVLPNVRSAVLTAQRLEIGASYRL